MAFIAPAEEVQGGFVAPDEEKIQGGFVAPKEDSPMSSRVDMGDLGTVNLNALPSSPSDDLAKLNQVTQQVRGFIAPPHELTPLEQSKQPMGPDDFANFNTSMIRGGALQESPEQAASELEQQRQQRGEATSGIERNIGGSIKGAAQNIGTAGNLIPAGLADIGTLPQREPEESDFPNVSAVLAGQKPEYQTTYEQPYMPKAISMGGKTAAGMLSMAPKLAATAGAEAVGVPAPVATGLLFGFDDEGNFSPKNAAIAAVLPTASKWAGGITSDVASKLGIEGASKLNLANAGGRYATANAIIAAQSLPDWSGMTTAQRQDAVAGILSQGLIGLMDFHGYDATDPDKVNAAIQDAAVKAKSGVKPFEVTSEATPLPKSETQPAAEPPPAAPIASKPLGTVGDQIGAKLDEIKALLTQQSTTETPNEQVQRVSEETQPQTGSDITQGSSGVYREPQIFQSGDAAQSSGGEAQVNEPLSTQTQPQATEAVPERAESGESNGPAPVREVPTNQATDTGATPVETSAAEPLVDRPVNKSPEDTLNSAKTIKVVPPEGATQIRVTTTDGKTAIRPLTQINKGDNPFRGVDVAKIEAGTIGKDKKFVPVSGDIKVTDKTPVKVLGFGGGSYTQDETPIANSPAEMTELTKSHTPGLEAVSGAKQGIQSLLLPSAKSAEHLTAAEDLGAKLGAMNRRSESASENLRAPGKQFDKLGVHREDLSPADNPGIKFMSDLSQGRPVEPRFEEAAKRINTLFDDRVQKLSEAGAPLEKVRENYFPGMWTRESREAFNAAMSDAAKEGIIKEGDDVNSATAEQKKWVKYRVDDYLEKGQGSDKDMLSYFTRQPMKGRESFRKGKVFDDIMTGAEFGLKPISNNPIDLVKGKLAEMDKSIMANQFFQEQKAKGKLNTISPYEEVPQGWTKINDKYGTIYGKPTVDVSEHVDKAVYDGLLDAANKLGIKHERSMKFPAGKNQSALGLSYQGQDLVRTKFATETSVLAHEIGHQIDHKYDLWNQITGGEKGNERKSDVQKELRAIADMTGNRGGKTRSKEEKIAQMVEAYVHAPERMQEAAPTVFKKFDDFIRSKPELAGMADIKPGIELKTLKSDKYVGLPIMGYRIVPEASGDVINNYLSSSLYNNKYFGGLYKGWMATANALNQSQLGLGSAFHAGFTTLDAQVSAGANVLKDIYGAMRGNRTLGDLADTAKKFTTASVKTAITGDKVLNAWRNPEANIDPKVAQIVKATELAGGAYHMERGMQTEQTTKMARDWYSGDKLKAIARSPIALTEAMAKPIMNYLVPRQKAGVFAELASRIIDQNPDKALEDLKPEFRQAWNRVDARLGQVVYDRLFMNNTAKNVIQGLIRAPGWTGGTIAELGGAFHDAAKFAGEWAKTGKAPANIPDRAAYALSLLTTMAAANGVLTYALTGKTPHGMDFLAFRSGQKDKQGNDERFLLPSYIKDLLAYWQHPGTTLLNKTHPLISMVNDVAKNRDYYGYEIRDPHANALTQAGQVSKYVVKQFVPFWVRGVQQNKGGAIGKVGPLVGVMPATANINRTAIQNKIAELYYQRTGEPLKPYGQRESDAEKAAKTYKTPLDVYQYNRLPYSDKVALRQEMNTQEQAKYPIPKTPKK